jgi:hypothetical protein
MSRRLVFIDESIRSNRYLLCAASVEASRAGQLRRDVRGMLLPGQRRLHFRLEGKRRRRLLLARLVKLDLDIHIFQSRITPERTAEGTRARCLSMLVEQAQAGGGAATLYIERRDGLDDHDRETIVRTRESKPALNFEHLRPQSEPLLWIPDAFAWAVGARGEWLDRVRDAVTIHDVA